MAGDGHGPTSARDDRVRVVLRPIGTPIALGLGAILLGTTMLSGLQMEWLSGADEQRVVAFVGLAAAFPLELIAAVLAFLARDALAGTGLGLFSSVWATAGLTLLVGQPGATNEALGMFLFVAAAGLVLLLLSAGASRVVFGVVIVCGAARLTLTGLYEVTGDDTLMKVAGISGFVLAAACAYGIVALLQEDLPRKAFLPVGRSGRAESSVHGGFADQLESIEHEAGVRRQL